MLFFMNLFFILFVLASLVFQKKLDGIEKDYRNIFKSTFYSEYRLQLQTFVLNELPKYPNLHKSLQMSLPSKFEQKEITFIRLILDKKFLENQKSSHKEMMLHFREFIRSQEVSSFSDSIKKEFNHFLEEFALWIFTKANLEQSVNKFIEAELPITTFNVLADEHLSMGDFLSEIHRLLRNNPKYQADENNIKELNDPLLEGDMPSRLFSIRLNENKTTEIIRTSNIARDTSLDEQTGRTKSAVINEEFIQYLQGQKKRGKKHLYINLMSRHSLERAKSLLIENLDQHPEWSNTCMVVTLDKSKSSNIYFQKGRYKKIFCAKEFKSSILEDFFALEGEFYWSLALNKHTWKRTCHEILEKVHLDYFYGKETLSEKEKFDFIEIAYVIIIKQLIQELEPDVVNISCKQSVDRGPSLYTLFYLMETLPHTPDRRKMVNMFFGPPLLIKGRACHDYRVSRFQSSSSRIWRKLM